MVERRPREWTEEEISNIAAEARQELEIRDRSYRWTTYQDCFVATQLTDWFIVKEHAADRDEAVSLGKQLVEHLHIVHVCRDHDFKDQYLFFRFMQDTRDKGHVLAPANGDPPKSWSMFLE